MTRSHRWLAFAIVGLLAVGVTSAFIVDSPGTEARGRAHSRPSVACPGTADNGTRLPPGTDLVRIETSGSFDDELKFTAKYDDDIPDPAETGPGSLSIVVEFIAFPLTSDGTAFTDIPPYVFLVVGFPEGYRVRGDAASDSDGQGGGPLDPTASRVDVDGDTMQVTVRADILTRFADQAVSLQVESTTYQFRSGLESVTDQVIVDTSGSEEIGRETCPNDDSSQVAEEDQPAPDTTTTTPTTSSSATQPPPEPEAPGRPAPGEPGSLVLAVGLSATGESDLGPSDCDGGPSLCSRGNRIDWQAVADEIITAVETETGRTMNAPEYTSNGIDPFNGTERAAPGDGFLLRLISDGTVDVSVSVLTETAYSWAVETVSDFTTEGS